jgi:hypothetical protein
MVLAQKQTKRTMEQNRRPREKLLQLQSFDFQQRTLKHTLEKRQPIQQMVPGKLDIHMNKTET